MNKSYQLIWNEVTGLWLAVSETTRGRGKRASAVVWLAAHALALGLCAAPALATPPSPPALTQLPTGGQVVAGSASIGHSAATLTVNQSSSRAAIDWATFNVGSQAKVQFNQPGASSVTLNRVLDANPSQIFGQIRAPGQVFLSNPSGVYFAPGASVDVGGLVATTHSISNADFMAGASTFDRHGATGSVVNEGVLHATLGGYIALLAPEVRNQGVIVAQLGTVALAAGEAYQLQFEGNHLSNILVSPATIAALVDNQQAVQAPGGLIILSAQAARQVQGGVVNNAGLLEASGLEQVGGTIRLAASHSIQYSGSIHDDGGSGNGNGIGNGAAGGGHISLVADLSNPDSRTEVSGTVSARGGAQGGDGGFVETSAATLDVADSARFDTSAPLGQTGTWLIDPKDFTIASGKAGTVTAGVPSGDISGATLGTALATSNVTIASGLGSTVGGSGDIHVNDAVSWSHNTLTLIAARDINIQAVMTAGAVNNSGSAGTYALLALNAATANNGDAAVATGLVKTALGANGFAGRVDFVQADGVAARTGAGFLSIGGAGYTVLGALGAQGSTTALDLQGMNGNLTLNHALGANIEAGASSGWTNKFTPGGLTGSFKGLGHTVRNLVVKGSGMLAYQSGGLGVSNVGLVGGSVSNTSQYAGAVVGWTYGPLSNVFNAGMSVTSTSDSVGGIAGWVSGTVQNSFSTGAVAVTVWAGGLIGYASSGTISSSWSSGNVTVSTAHGGGLIGYLASAVLNNTYANGLVTGTAGSNHIGGLVGYAFSGTVSNSYAASSVTGTSSNRGSFVGGRDTGATLTNNFYDSSINAALPAVGVGSTTGVRALGTADMQAQSNFTSATAANGNVNPNWNFTSVWTINPAINNGYPYLQTAPPCGVCYISPLTISLANTSKVYGNANPALSGYSATGLLPGDSLTSLDWGSAAPQFLGVGSYAYSTSNLLVPAISYASGHSASDYSIGWSNNSLTISQRPITVTADAQTKVYGSADPSLSYALTSGSLVNGDSLSGALARAVGNSVGSYAIGQGTLAASSNYALTYAGANLGITPASLTISANPVSKTYDATTAASGTAVALSALYFSDTLSGGTFAFADKNAGTNKTVNVSAVTVNDGNGGANYSVSYAPNTLSTISPRAITISASSNTKTYDGSVLASAVPVLSSGVLQGTDTLTGLTEVYDLKTASAANGRTLSVDSYTLSDGNSGANYAVTLATAAGTINQRTLTVSGIAASSKTYDGSTSAMVVSTGAVFGGLVSGDAVSVASSTGVFADKHVATGKTVTLTTTYGGSDLANYTVTDQASATASIVAKVLDLSGSKAYDAGTGVAATSLTLAGLVGSETLALSGSGSTVDKNVGTDKPFTLGTLALGNGTNGEFASNYTLSGGSDKVTINKVGITVSGITAANKTYDGGTSATVDSTGVVFGGLLSGDVASVASSTGVFADKHVATGKTVTLTTTYSGSDLANYSVTDQASATASIVAKVLDLSGSKAYDAGTGVAATSLTLGGLVGSETLALSGSGSTADKNVGTDKPFTLGTLALGNGTNGELASNYTLSGGSDKVTINKVGITVSGITASNKQYDGSSAATVSTTGAVLNGLINGDAVSVTSTGAFDNKNAGLAKTVTLTNTLVGTDVGNYTFTHQVSTTANITPKVLTASGLAATSKTYDGTTSVAISNWGSVATGVGSEVLTLNHGTAAFDTAGAGSAKTVSASGYSLADAGSGATAGLAANYTLSSSSASTTANITQAALLVSANNDAKFVTLADAAGYNGETSAVLTGTASVARSNSSTQVAGVYTGVLVPSGLGSANYAISYAPGNYTIVPSSQLKVKVTDASTTYGTAASFGIASAQYFNGSTAVDLAGITDNGSNNFTVTDGAGGSATFTVTPLAPSTSTSGNLAVGAYQLGLSGVSTLNNANFSNTITLVGSQSVIAKGVTANASGGVSKVYDGNTSMSGVTINLTGQIANDVLTVSGDGAFTQKNAGSSLGYTVDNLALGGADSGNYVLTGGTSFAGSNGAIAAKTLDLSGSKQYDAGTTVAATSLNLSGLVGLETLLLSGSGSTADKNVGTGKTVSLGTLALANGSGGDLASNYTLVGGKATVTITKATLTLSGITADNKAYDGGTSATVKKTGALLTGLIAGDAVSVASSSGTFADKDVATGKTVTLTNTFGGTDAGNYSITDQTSTTADITRKVLDLSGSKVYDAGIGVAASKLSLSGLVGTETLVLSGSGSTDNKNVEAGKTVSLGTLALGNGSNGGLASNYTLTSGNASVDIKQADLTLSGITAANKVYDGSTGATLNSSGAVLSGLISGDGVSFASSGAFSDQNAATGKTVTLTNSFNGPDLGNYAVTGQASTTADIMPKALTAVGASAADKVYDGSVSAQALPGSLSGLVGTETLRASVRTAQFTDAHAGANKAVTLAFTLANDSGLASNYRIADAVTSASIGTRPVIVAADAQGKTLGQNDPPLSYRAEAPTTGRGLVAGERLAGSLSRTPGEAQGSYPITQGTVTNSSNPDYGIAFVGADFVITANQPLPVLPPVPPPPGTPWPPTLPEPEPLPDPGPQPGLGLGLDTSLNPNRLALVGAWKCGKDGETNSAQSPDVLVCNGMLSASGVWTTLVRNPQQQADGLVLVQIARPLIVAGNRLDFPLPPTVADAVTADNPLRISTPGGQDIPAWLAYDPGAQRLVATQVPPGALPLNLVLVRNGLRWLVLLTDGSV